MTSEKKAVPKYQGEKKKKQTCWHTYNGLSKPIIPDITNGNLKDHQIKIYTTDNDNQLVICFLHKVLKT